jgi:phage gp45-like
MWAALMSMITRGKVAGATVGPRTELQVTALDNETFNGVELLLPPGYTARPSPGADVMILQCNGTRDHKVALAGDAVGQVQVDLQPGEWGLVGNGHRIILRTGKIELVDKAGSSLVLDGTGNIIATPNGGQFQVNAPIAASQGMAVTGAITATANVTAGFGTTNIGLLGLEESGVTPGGGDSGPPVPGT